MPPDPLQEVTEVGNVCVLLNHILTLSTAAQHVLHLEEGGGGDQSKLQYMNMYKPQHTCTQCTCVCVCVPAMTESACSVCVCLL